MKEKNDKLKSIIKCILIVVVYGVIYMSLGELLKKIPYLNEFEYLKYIIVYIVVTIILVTYLYYTKKIDVLKFNKRQFFKGLVIGLALIIVASVKLVDEFSSCIEKGYHLLPAIKIIIFLVALLGTGFVEEVLFRGIVLNNMFEAFGRNTRKDVIISILISSIMFGMVHISNGFTSSNLSTAFYQALFTTGLGIIFGAIYSRGKSIYSVMLIHSFWDISNRVSSGFYGIGKVLQAVDTSNGQGLVVIAIAYIIVFIPAFLFLMRKKKENEYLEINDIETKE